jgi:hypothetical protein
MIASAMKCPERSSIERILRSAAKDFIHGIALEKEFK